MHGSERITVRHAGAGDAEAFHRILTGPRVVEGTHLRLAFRNGEYVDAYFMARIR